LLSNATVKLSEGIRLREESWGGLLFRQDDGTVIDVDRDAFALLTFLNRKRYATIEDLWIAFPGKGNNNQPPVKMNAEITAVVKQLIDLGIIKVCPNGDSSGEKYGENAVNTFLKPENLRHSPSVFQLNKETYTLSVPETVHWAITFKCTQVCPDCYAGRYRKQDIVELDTFGALQVVEKLAGLGVFQLAIGGGEPFLRPDLQIITQAAEKAGLAVHVTTGLTENLDFELLDKLTSSIKSLHIGVTQDRLISWPQSEIEMFRQITRAAQALGLRVGANLIVNNSALKHFEQIIDVLAEAGFERIILLRYKPPSDIERWLAEKPSQQAYLDLEAVLRKTVKLNPHLEFRLDCALSFLQRNQDPAAALAAGIRGCVAGNRVMAIAPDGAAYPCSQLMYPGFKAGNILDGDFTSLWGAELMNKYRNFREERKFKETKCGTCLASRQCGGCRVFANDALGDDPGCGAPLFPPACNLGREGRQAVLHSYFDRCFSITVDEYMEYFQVGRQKASKELRNASWLMPGNQVAHGRKKIDPYIKADAYLLEEIQDSIGFTSGGAPFASLEEINEWVKGPDLLDYPDWLLATQDD